MVPLTPEGEHQSNTWVLQQDDLSWLFSVKYLYLCDDLEHLSVTKKKVKSEDVYFYSTLQFVAETVVQF